MRHVMLAAGESPNQEGIDRSEKDFPCFGTGAQAADVVEQVFDFGAGKVGIDHKPGLRVNRWLQAVGF